MTGLDGKRILITGGAGFVGARVARRALEGGARVTLLTRLDTTASRISGLDVERVVADVRDAARVHAVFEAARPDLVIHAAAWADWQQDPEKTAGMLATNVMGAAAVLEAARRTRVGRTVLVGSAGEYGDSPDPLAETARARPVDPYSASKLAATEVALMYHRSFRVEVTVVRPFVIYGPGEPEHRLFPSLFQAALRGDKEMGFTPGEQLRDFVHVDDVAEGILRATVEPGAAGEILNLGTGVGTQVKDAVQAALVTSTATLRPSFGLLAYRQGEPMRLVANVARARRLLHWQPTILLEEGLTSYWATFTKTPMQSRRD